MDASIPVDLIVVAGGKGERLGSGVPKAFTPLLGKPLVDWTLDALLPLADWASVTVVAPPDVDWVRDGVEVVSGGTTRAHSAHYGLNAGCAAYVLIHDAARPFPPESGVKALLKALAEGAPSASLAAPVRDTLQRGDGSPVDRRDLWALQTPQGFQRGALEEAFSTCNDRDFTDETALINKALQIVPTLIPSQSNNLKITYPEDVQAAERVLLSRFADVRVGHGYDVHAFGPGDHVILGGIKIPHSQGVEAHSDGDVLAHALADALYGTLADQDIGAHFPPGKAETKGMDSALIVKAAKDAVLKRGGIIAHADLMLLAESPKLSPHRDAIRQTIAAWLGMGQDRVSVKATTTEKLGFIGRNEGLAAQAVVTVRF